MIHPILSICNAHIVLALLIKPLGSGQCLLKIKYRGNHSCIIAVWNWVCCHSNIKIYTIWCNSSAITCSPSFNSIASLLAEIFSILCFDFHIVTPYDVIST